jgi:hypothetical protein
MLIVDLDKHLNNYPGMEAKYLKPLKVGYSPYVNKAFVYISVFKILNFIRQLFIFSCFYSIINDQDTAIRLCKNIK